MEGNNLLEVMNGKTFDASHSYASTGTHIHTKTIP